MPRLRSALALTALVGGGLLYLGARPTSLRLFEWAAELGLGGAVALLRGALGPVLLGLPAWVVGSLPFALWLFALTCLTRRSTWVALGPSLAIGAELGQLVELVPGTFDPVDLALLVAATGLGLVPLGKSDETSGQPSFERPGLARQLQPAMLLAGFVVLAAGTSEDPEAKAEREAKEKVALEGLTQYIEQMQLVHTKLSALDPMRLEDKACDVADMKAKGKVEYDRLSLRTVRLSFLARFGADKSAWTESREDPWGFFDDSTYAGHFREHPDARESYALKDTAERVQETFLPERYLVVIVPLAAEAMILPKMQSKHFDGGYFEGFAVLVDQTTAEVACQYHFAAGSSDSIDYGGLLDGKDPEKEMLEDFEDNIEDAIESVLPKGIELSTGYGSILD